MEKLEVKTYDKSLAITTIMDIILIKLHRTKNTIMIQKRFINITVAASVFKEIEQLSNFFRLSATIFYFVFFSVNSIQDGGEGWGEKTPSTSFSPVTSTNIGTSPPHNFLLLVLTLLPHWCKISSLYLVPVPNYST